MTYPALYNRIVSGNCGNFRRRKSLYFL